MKTLTAVLLTVVSAFSTPASAACQLALSLGLDVSTSVNETEYQLQRNGLAAALASPDVRAALLAGPDTVALSIYEWSGRNQQQIVVDWVEVVDQAVLNGIVATVLNHQRSFENFPTAVGFALGFGANLLARSPRCDRKTLDLSGDGVNNDGFGPIPAYRNFPFQDVTVNGLVIRTSDHRVPLYYRDEIIRGPGSFIEIAEDFEDFENAMKRKLLREIGVMIMGENQN